MNKIRPLLIALLLLAALAAGFLLQSRSTMPESAVTEWRAATVLPAPTDLPKFQLHDQHGNAFNERSFNGQWTLLFFGFTHCPDICPLTLQKLSAVKKQLASQGGPLPRIVLISVDPERDTRDVIGQYVDYFGSHNVGVSGDLTELEKLTAGLGIYFAKQPTGDNDYAVDHSSAVLLVNPNGRFHGLFSGDPSIDDYVFDLSQILARPPPTGVPLVASDVSVLAPLPGSPMSVGYLTLSNQEAIDIEVVKVSSEQFDSVQLHTTDSQDGVARMRSLQSITIPGNSAVTFEPGGHHLMLRGFRNGGETLQLRFHTADDNAIVVGASLMQRKP